MTKGFEYQLTTKAETLLAFSQLLQSDTDCVRHLYKVLREAEEEENKEYHTNRLLSKLFRTHPLPPFNCLSSFPVDRNIAQWGIKINRVKELMDHLDMIKMIGGSSKECGSPYYSRLPALLLPFVRLAHRSWSGYGQGSFGTSADASRGCARYQ